MLLLLVLYGSGNCRNLFRIFPGVMPQGGIERRYDVHLPGLSRQATGRHRIEMASAKSGLLQVRAIHRTQKAAAFVVLLDE